MPLRFLFLLRRKAVIRLNFPALDGSWCIMDGLKIPIQKPGDESTQNAYYNGWLHNHFVGSVFLLYHLDASLLAH